jgi:DNA-binding NarL/FixJ family response regulator
VLDYVERTFAAELLSDGRGGVGYLLKDGGGRRARLRRGRAARRGGRHRPRPRGGRAAPRPRRLAPRRPHAARARRPLAHGRGRSNAAIAERLVVTEGAVEKHVSNIFGTLGLPPSEQDHRRVLTVLAWVGD